MDARYITLIRFALAIALAGPVWCAVIEGVVLENKTGKPVARARVHLDAVKDGSTAAPIYSDAKGNFRFTGLSAGSYQLSAERAGFVTNRFGQPSVEAGGSPISLTGEGHFFAQLRLQRPGSILGFVQDENGIGMANFSISAYRLGARPKLMAAVSTDDRGLYRFPALGPGLYVVVTASRIGEGGDGFVPTFYGGSTALEQARGIDVALDNETTGVNIQPLPGMLNQIRGNINAPGILAVQLLGSLGMQDSPVRADGSFEFRGIPSGRYTVAAGNDTISGAEAVVVSGEDRFVGLKLGPSPAVRLNCSSLEGKPAESGLALFLERDLMADGQERRLDCGKQMALPSGGWRIRPLPLSNTYVDTVTGMSAPEGRSDGFRLTAGPGETLEIHVTLGAKPASVRGQVRLRGGDVASGIPVGLIAIDDGVHRRMGGARLTRADAQGKFRLDGLAPGDYRVFSTPGLDSVTAVDNFSAAGQTMRLEQEEQKEVELTWEP
jgi:Carboxypeptidase regulatory-like domain